ncbi:flagellar filament capping protein FliD [Clostridium coskatii]|uniref:Flagellar hook-associated protein 2 n=1 Tax=Clostridium coskatii TaxID=1705578 RepID=A0A166TG96_9CLOT|nr:flagellar filament capping protein FliD [Clostridium coskatii]OAA93653.1 flagellar capping protein [Clostridium coskatii]OBR89985.1 flagellar capping protein [Clostridium coskatii]
MSDVSSVTSGTTGAGGGNMIRLTGLASGLDVDALVKKMMAAEQAKLDKAKQDQQTTQWKQEAYQDIIKDIKDLQSSFFDASSSDKDILAATNFAPFNVSSADGLSAVDTSVATFTPGVGAKTGKYSISVKQLAKGAGISNTLYVPSNQTATKAQLSTKLTDIDPSLSGSVKLGLNANNATSDFNVTLDNTSGTATLGDLINAINDQGSGSVKATYSELTGQFNLNSTRTGSDTSLAIKSGSTASLSTILGFSAANSAGVTTADWTVSSTSTDTATGKIQKGQNADVIITPPGGSGVEVTDKTSNNFTIDGMTYTLSSEGTDSTHPVTASVTVGQDTQKVYDKIKSFIDKYNAIVDEIQTKLTEKPNSDYKPLTDAQKAEMSSTQITAWETKAKVGILRNDDNLQNLLDNLTTAFTTAVNNTGLSMGRYGGNSIGIDTSQDYTTPDHIDIADPTALKTAISNNCDQILKMFTNVSTAAAPIADDGSTKYDTSTQEYQEDGIFTRINTILQKNVGFTNTTLNTAILTSYANKQYDFTITGTGGKNTLPDQLYEEQLNIKKITAQMSTDQEKYYKQFSNLETVMNQLNAQQSQLSSMLGN